MKGNRKEGWRSTSCPTTSLTEKANHPVGIWTHDLWIMRHLDKVASNPPILRQMSFLLVKYLRNRCKAKKLDQKIILAASKPLKSLLLLMIRIFDFKSCVWCIVCLYISFRCQGGVKKLNVFSLTANRPFLNIHHLYKWQLRVLTDPRLFSRLAEDVSEVKKQILGTLLAWIILAASSAVLTWNGALRPDLDVKKAGNSPSWPNEATLTPWVSWKHATWATWRKPWYDFFNNCDLDM